MTDIVGRDRQDDLEADEGYQRYIEEMEAQEKRARERVRLEPPMKWGDPFPLAGPQTGYFCEPEWRDGGTGFHPYGDPPCDPVRRIR